MSISRMRKQEPERAREQTQAHLIPRAHLSPEAAGMSSEAKAPTTSRVTWAAEVSAKAFNVPLREEDALPQ